VAGEDLFLDVPPGTAVYDDDTDALIADLVRPGQTAIIGRGGRGGLGNTHFKTSTHQAPKHAQKGEPGEERWLRLELRLIADIGLVGLPNAGKSTLLAALTAARPKIADYPFTTLEPNLGVMDLGDEDERRPTIADVPGLIEGASSGAGLGHAFLRHVERTRVLVHVVDGSGRDPEWDHGVIRDELEAHDPKLLVKPMLVVFNKLDLPTAAEAWPSFRRAREKAGQEAIALSAVSGEGIPALRERLATMLPAADELVAPPEPAGVVVHRIEGMTDGFVVDREDGVFRVRGKRIERIAAQTNFEVEESAERFQRDLARLGIDTELRRAGIVPGDLVRIGGAELEWEAQPWEER
jgi:GTP-binding protein